MVGVPSPLLSTAEVARMLGVSTRTVRLWAECSELPAFKAGRQWRFQAEAITSWLRNHQSGAPLPASLASDHRPQRMVLPRTPR
jgi:excisionase family DNA binding protein